jgi:ABC-type phosphate/phosphonate transport system substrate-binding protein
VNRRSFPFAVLFLFLILVLANCNLPRVELVPPTPTSTETAVPGVTPTDTFPPPFPTVELGLAENPVILALPPAADRQEQLDAAKLIASEFTRRTGYTVVTVIPDSQLALVDALEKGNAHIALLSPYAYELAYQRGLVRAAYAVLEDGEGLYGAQFLATRRGGFTSYFDEENGENTEDASIALLQFQDKKPCWSDESSPSGYVIPLGYLKANQIRTRDPAFVGGHPTVVRSLYASGICDFGGTYVDARKFPSLEDEFPDLIERVIVVWRIPPIIPYEVLVFSTQMPQHMRDLFTGLVPAIMQTNDGRAAFKTAYDIDDLQAVNDGYYSEFRFYLQASGLDLTLLVR